MKHMKRLWRRLYESELDLRIERWIGHRLGWCTDACRGRTKPPCGPDLTRLAGYQEARRGRWWRWTY